MLEMFEFQADCGLSCLPNCQDVETLLQNFESRQSVRKHSPLSALLLLLPTLLFAAALHLPTAAAAVDYAHHQVYPPLGCFCRCLQWAMLEDVQQLCQLVTPTAQGSTSNIFPGIRGT